VAVQGVDENKQDRNKGTDVKSGEFKVDLSFAIFCIFTMLTINLLDSDPNIYFSTP